MRRRAVPLLLVSALFLPGGARAASSAETDEVLPVTVQVPYGFLFLHLPAFSAKLPPMRQWRFEVGMTLTNNFIYSDNFGEMLAARTARAPVTHADIDAFAASHPGEDYYFFDAQVATGYAFAATGISDSFAVGVRVATIGISGGEGMDGFVEGFHSAFGLGQQEREAVTRGGITAAVRIDGDAETQIDNARVGLGDPILYAQWSPRRSGAWNYSLAGGVKVPIGSTDKRLSTGRADAGVAFAVTGELGRWCVNVNGGVVVPGSVSFLPAVETSPFAGASASFGYRFRRTSLWAEAQWEQSPLRDATQTPLSDDVHDVSFGVRFPLVKQVRGYFALTENVFAFDNSSDIAFNFGVTWGAGTP